MINFNPMQPPKGDVTTFTQDCIQTNVEYVFDENDLGTDQRTKVREITSVSSEKK